MKKRVKVTVRRVYGKQVIQYDFTDRNGKGLVSFLPDTTDGRLIFKETCKTLGIIPIMSYEEPIQNEGTV